MFRIIIVAAVVYASCNCMYFSIHSNLHIFILCMCLCVCECRYNFFTLALFGVYLCVCAIICCCIQFITSSHMNKVSQSFALLLFCMLFLVGIRATTIWNTQTLNRQAHTLFKIDVFAKRWNIFCANVDVGKNTPHNVCSHPYVWTHNNILRVYACVRTCVRANTNEWKGIQLYYPFSWFSFIMMILFFFLRSFQRTLLSISVEIAAIIHMFIIGNNKSRKKNALCSIYVNKNIDLSFFSNANSQSDTFFGIPLILEYEIPFFCCCCYLFIWTECDDKKRSNWEQNNKQNHRHAERRSERR